MTDYFFGSATIILLFAISLISLVPAVKHKVLDKFSKNENLPIIVVLILSLSATMGSLWYSEIIGFEPCKLCWFQRIFMYPIVLISFIGWQLRDVKSMFYIKALAMVGIVIATYHVIIQRIPQTGLSCGTVGQGVSCDGKWVNAFGLVTIPLMALTIFIAILLVIMLAQRAHSKTNNSSI